MEVRLSIEQYKKNNTDLTVRSFRLPPLWGFTLRRFLGTFRDKDCWALQAGAASLSLKVVRNCQSTLLKIPLLYRRQQSFLSLKGHKTSCFYIYPSSAQKRLKF